MVDTSELYFLQRRRGEGMLWSRKEVEFSEEDCQAYLDLALPQIVEAVGEPIYVCGSSLITESHIERQVESLLSSATTTLDTTAIATQIGVPRVAVDAVITRAIKNVGAFFDNVHVLPAKQLADIAQSLTNISKIGEICTRKGITIKAAEHIVKSSDKLTLVGDVIVPNEVLETHLTAFQNALQSAEAPLKYKEVEPNDTLLELIKTKLNIPPHQTRFLPQVYTEKHTQQAAEILEQVGYVAQSVFAEFIDPAKFAKSHESIVLGSWVVQKKFVQTKTKEIQAALQSHLYFDLRDLPLGPDLAKHIVSEDPKLAKLKGDGKKYPANYLVKSQLEKDVLASVSSTVLKTAAEKAEAVPLDKVNGTSTLNEFVDKVSLPTLAEVQEQIPESQVPADLKIGPAIWPSIRQSYRVQVSKCLEPLFETAQLKLEAHITVYLNGVLSLVDKDADSDLIDMAWHEWQQYVSERQYNVPSSFEIAKSQFKADDYVDETRTTLIAKSQAKLDKVLKSKKKDGALVLHLAATIYHATHFSPHGLLKIRGKAVPKLLKQYEFPASFTELKSKIRDPSPELLDSVRSTVV